MIGCILTHQTEEATDYDPVSTARGGSIVRVCESARRSLVVVRIALEYELPEIVSG